MMKRIALILILITCTGRVNLFPQSLSLSAESGIGTYRMSDLREYNDNFILSLPFEARITDDFPPYWYFRYCLQYTFTGFLSAGVTYSVQSTGSRIAVADYSGEFRLDMKVKGASGGLFVEAFKRYNRVMLSVISEAGVTGSKMDFFEFLRVGTESEQRIYEYKASNWYYLPKVQISYGIAFIRAGISAGYQVDLSKDIFEEVNGYPGLMVNDTKKAGPGWSGFRAGATVAFVLDLSHRKERKNSLKGEQGDH